MKRSNVAASSLNQLASVPEGVEMDFNAARAIAVRLQHRRIATPTRRPGLRSSGRYNLAPTPTPAPAPASIPTTRPRLILKTQSEDKNQERLPPRSIEERIKNPIIDPNDCDAMDVDRNDESGSREEAGEENGSGEEDNTDDEESSEGDSTEDGEDCDQEDPPTELERNFEKKVLFRDDFHFNDADFSVLLLVQIMVAGKFLKFRVELEKLVCEAEKRMTKNVRLELAQQVLASGADHFVTVKNPHKESVYSVLDPKYIIPKEQPATPVNINGLTESLQGMSMGGPMQEENGGNE